MSWLGYTEQQTLDTSIPALELAADGMLEVWRICYGVTQKTEPKPAPEIKPMPAESVFAAFRAAAAYKPSETPA